MVHFAAKRASFAPHDRAKDNCCACQLFTCAAILIRSGGLPTSRTQLGCRTMGDTIQLYTRVQLTGLPAISLHWHSHEGTQLPVPVELCM